MKRLFLVAILIALAFPALAQQAQPVGPGYLLFTPATPFPRTLAGSATWSSGVASMRGYRGITITATGTQTTTISIQRYLDSAGLVPIGSAVSQILPTGGYCSATYCGTASVNDGLPAGYFQMTIANTSGSTSTITQASITLTGM